MIDTIADVVKLAGKSGTLMLEIEPMSQTEFRFDHNSAGIDHTFDSCKRTIGDAYVRGLAVLYNTYSYYIKCPHCGGNITLEEKDEE